MLLIQLKTEFLQIFIGTILQRFKYSDLRNVSLNNDLYHLSLQNFNTSPQHSKNYTGYQSNKESITNPVFLHTKHWQIVVSNPCNDYILYYNKKQDCLSRVVMVMDEKPQILNCNIQFYFKWIVHTITFKLWDKT